MTRGFSNRRKPQAHAQHHTEGSSRVVTHTVSASIPPDIRGYPYPRACSRNSVRSTWAKNVSKRSSSSCSGSGNSHTATRELSFPITEEAKTRAKLKPKRASAALATPGVSNYLSPQFYPPLCPLRAWMSASSSLCSKRVPVKDAASPWESLRSMGVCHPEVKPAGRVGGWVVGRGWVEGRRAAQGRSPKCSRNQAQHSVAPSRACGAAHRPPGQGQTRGNRGEKSDRDKGKSHR